MSIVLLQLMSLNPLVATLFVDMDFMVIRTDGNFCKKQEKKKKKEQVNSVTQITNKLDQFLVPGKYQAGLLNVKSVVCKLIVVLK